METRPLRTPVPVYAAANGDKPADANNLWRWLQLDEAALLGNRSSGSGQASGGTSGIHLYSGSSAEDSGDDNLVRWNMSYANKDIVAVDGNGIEVDQWCDGNTVAYNVAWGNDGAGLKAMPPVRTESILDPNDSTKKLDGYVMSWLMYPGLQVGSVWSICRIKHLTEDAGKGLSDAPGRIVIVGGGAASSDGPTDAELPPY